MDIKPSLKKKLIKPAKKNPKQAEIIAKKKKLLETQIDIKIYEHHYRSGKE